MPIDFRTGYSKYTDDEFARKTAAGYGGLKTPPAGVKQEMTRQMHEAIKGLGSQADDPADVIVKQRQRGREGM